MSRRSTGKAAEDAAAKRLRREGYKILERNFSTPLGEVDIIALDGEVLCFIEVRFRSSNEFGGAIEALSSEKKRRVARMALNYLKARRLEDADMRFDFAAVEKTEGGEFHVEIIKEAFWPGEHGRRG